MTDLFATELAEAEAALVVDDEQKKAVAIARRKNRTFTRRAKSEQHLDEIMPTIETDASYHVLSHGDIDSMTYLIHLLKKNGPLDTLMISTWCMAMPDIEQTAIHTSRDLHDFYAEFFADLKDIDARSKLKATVDA